MTTPRVVLKSATLKCALCKSTLMLRGCHAQRVAESGTCPVCNTQGMLTVVKMTV